MMTEYVTTNVIVAVVEIVTRFAPLPPVLINEQMANAVLQCRAVSKTNIVGIVENGDITEGLRMQYGTVCKCDQCSGEWLFEPDNLPYSSVRKFYMEIGCPYCNKKGKANDNGIQRKE